jgi:hypothetical protein
MGGFMKRAIEIRSGDRVFDRGTSFRVSQIYVDEAGHLHFVDAQGFVRGPYVPGEYIGIAEEPSIRLSTTRFAQLLQDAKAWDSRYKAMRDAKTNWLITNFCFADNLCVYVTLENRRAWDIPHLAGRHLFTRCG